MIVSSLPSHIVRIAGIARIPHTLFISLALSLGAGEALAERVVPDEDGGAYTLTAGPLSVQIGPSKGARIRSLKFDDTELFYQDSSGSPSSHGSTFWPSPQAHWTANCRNSNNNGCWPPPTNLDGANTTYTGGLITADTVVSYTSAADNGTGVRLRKTLWADLADTSVNIRYHIVNTSESPVAFAGWEVTRFTSGGLLFWPKDDSETIEGNGTAGDAMIAMVRDTLGTKWFKYDSTTVPTGGTPKLWDGGTDGWFARVDQSRLVYIKKFEDTPPHKKAPVSENEIEIYASNRSGATGGMALVEMELQGPYDTIAAGDSLAWDVTWIVRPLPDSIPISSNSALLDFVNQVVADPVSLHSRVGTPTRARLALSGQGVAVTLAAPAKLSLDLIDSRGSIARRLHTGPLQTGSHAFELGKLPQGVYRLVLRGADGRVLESRMVPRL